MLASSSRLGLGWLARRASPWSWHMHAAGVAAHHPREHGHGGMGRHDRERGAGGPERRVEKPALSPYALRMGENRTRPVLLCTSVRTRGIRHEKEERRAPSPRGPPARAPHPPPHPGLASYSRPALNKPNAPFPRNPNGMENGAPSSRSRPTPQNRRVRAPSGGEAGPYIHGADPDKHG